VKHLDLPLSRSDVSIMKIRNLILISISAIIIITAFIFLRKVLGENPEKVKPVLFNNNFDKNESMFSSIYNTSGNFEGIIDLIQKNLYDTISYRLYVYKNKVKLNKNILKGKVDETLIFDLQNEVITALNHNKKLYYNLPKQQYINNNKSNFKIIKTNNVKNIIGYKCTQWRVKNDLKNTEITFWVTGKKYDFYHRFLKLWNKTENCYQFFLNIPEVEGYIPIQQVERTLLRDIKSTIIIFKITEQKVDTNLFNVPETYSLFSN